jgi:CubicO group peptidase (beta-lactamase class C family)
LTVNPTCPPRTPAPVRRTIRALLVTGYGSLFTVSLSAQSPDTILTRRVDSVFAPWTRTDAPGCAVGVDRDGAPVLRRAYGMANLETGTPWTVNTLSESGSVAKQFTAGAIVLAARDGLFSLDDDISRWIPEVRGFGKKITIRNLLSHTSGLPDRYTLHEVMGRPAGVTDHNNAEVLSVVAKLRELNFDPGEDYEYSNTGLIVAAVLLERASGKSLQAFTAARIFTPLGMLDTRWREDHRTVVPGRASAYSGTLPGGFRNDHPFTRVIGSGGLLTTVGDFLRWEAALQRGEGEWGAVRDSLERGMRLNDGTELTYGLGVGVDKFRGLRAVSHTGSTGGYRAALSRFPDQRVAVALLCNLGSINPGAFGQRVATLALGLPAVIAAPPEASSVTHDSAALAALAGAYHSPRTEEVLILSVVNGTLTDSVGRASLVPIAAGEFKYRGGQRTVTVIPGESRGPTRLLLELPNTRTNEFIAAARLKPDAVTLAGYAGVYRSPELEAQLHVTQRGDTLRLETVQSWQEPIVLRPLYRDGFYAGGAGLIRFERDKRGKVTGFVLWAGRVRHLRFVRER